MRKKTIKQTFRPQVIAVGDTVCVACDDQTSDWHGAEGTVLDVGECTVLIRVGRCEMAFYPCELYKV